MLFPSFLSVVMPSHVRPELGFLAVSRRALAVASITTSASLLFMGALPATATTVKAERFAEQSQGFQVAAYTDGLLAQRDVIGVRQVTPVQYPVAKKTKISSYFGPRSCAGCSSNHQGIDFTPGAGKRIEAIAPGKVVKVGNPSGALGVYAIIKHKIKGKTYYSVSAHMQLGSLKVKAGDKVKIGEKLGRVGSTGMSTGPHLHFGILNADKRAINPLPWLKKHVTK